MKHKFLEEIAIPEGITCSFSDKIFHCSKASKKLERKIYIPGVGIKIEDGKIVFSAKKGNKKTLACIKTWCAHIRNLFSGLEKEFVYKMEICNVHFPMTVKVEGSKFVVTNFLGEKENRVANILDNVEVKINGVNVEVKSIDLERAGQTAANIEKATLVRKRDRRVFQDGIFITSKPGVEA
ncbi:MAG: 50S ribosomal protein L6 [Nanoarchaeota archaeon]